MKGLSAHGSRLSVSNQGQRITELGGHSERQESVFTGRFIGWFHVVLIKKGCRVMLVMRRKCSTDINIKGTKKSGKGGGKEGVFGKNSAKIAQKVRGIPITSVILDV